MKTTSRYLLSCILTLISLSAFAAGHTVSITVNQQAGCAGNSNGQATATVTGGTGPFSYLWDDAGSTASSVLMNAFAGTYTVTVTDQSDGSTATSNCTITEFALPPVPTITPGGPTTFCAGGSVNLTSSEVSSNLWNPNAETTQSITVTVSGVYTVTTTDVNGCSATSAPIVITVNPTPVMSSIADIEECEGANVPLVAFSSTPAGASFSWTNSNPSIGLSASGSSSSTPTFFGSAGTGTVTVTPTLNGCTGASQTFTITINANPTVYASSNSPVCEGSTLDLDAQPGGANYSWSGPQGFSHTNQSPSISPVSVSQAGNYSVFVTDNNGCTGSSMTNVVVNSAPQPTISSVGPFCMDDNTPVTLFASPSGGIFSGPGITDGSAGTFVPSSAGISGPVTITYDVTDPNGCVGQGTTTITLNGPPVNITASPQSGCAPLTVTFSGDSGMSSSLWAFGDGSSVTDMGSGTVTHTYVNPGVYDVTLTNTGTDGCANTVTISSFVTVGSGSSIVPVFTPVGPYCSGESIPPLPSVSNNGITGSWAPAINNTATTTYTYTPDPGQCAGTSTVTITINSPVTPTFTAVGPYCSGDAIPPLPTTSNNGLWGTWSPSINNTATTTYTFTPSAGQCVTTTSLTITINPQSTPTFNPFPPLCQGDVPPVFPATSNEGIFGTWNPSSISTATPGTWTYTFTSGAGQCATFTTMSITVGPQSVPTFNAIVPICSGGAAPALQNPSNEGIPGTWSPATINTAVPGASNYTFTATAGMCASSATLSVFINPSPTIVVSPSGTVTTCAGVPIMLTASGGTAYTWSPTTGLDVSNSSTVSANPSTTTTYTVDGVDANGCMGNATVTVTIGTSLTISVNSSSTTLCDGGSVTLSAFGGTDYTWSPPTGLSATTGSSVVVSGLTSPETYTVTGTTSGCTGSTSVTITPAAIPLVTATATDASCGSTCDGAIDVEVAGNGPFAYDWTGPSFSSPLEDLTDLCPGTYNLTVSDVNGCNSAVETIFIGAASVISAALTPTMPTSCTACDGEVTSFVSGGTAPLLYSWAGPGTGWVNDQPGIEGVCSGIYTFTVTDAGGCSETVSVELEAGQIDLAVSGTADNCGSGTGSADVAVTGATGNLTYHWEPGDMNTQSVFGLSGGTYTVTVSDEAGCSESDSVTITNTNAPFIYATTSPTDCGAATGSITATAAGGTFPYEYAINGGAYGSSGTFTGLAHGTYTVQAQDATGCIGSTTITVTNASNLFAYTDVTPTSCYDATNGAVEAIVYNGTAPYSYQWNNGATTALISNLATGTYNCTITDNAGCQTTVSASVYPGGFMTLYFDSAYDNCGTAELTAQVYNFYNPSPPYSYLWSNGATTETISNVAPGYYTVEVTDAAGCTTNGDYTVYDFDYSYITGKVFLDANTNCTLDAGDDPIHGWITATSGTGQNYQGYAYTDGNYSIAVPNGAASYTMTFHPYGFYDSPYYTLNCPVADVILNGTCDSASNVNFAFTATPAQDLAVSLYCGVARPGFKQFNGLSYFNPGTIEMDGTVKLDIDPLLTFAGATPTPDVVSGNHLEWNFTDLEGAESQYISFYTYVPTIDNGGALGTILSMDAAIEPISGDLTQDNNIYSCSTEIVGSYDPNMKEVYSPQAHSSGAIDSAGAEMYYTVHFQNTGTDTAFTVVVRDTLSPFVDITTLELLGGSHHYTWSLQPNRCLEVRFNNILLPDSNRNEPMSHGFFNYRIRTNDHLPLGAQIDNTAGIYFDFNEPVITNTVSSPIVAFANVEEKGGLEALVYPNPNNTGSVRVKLNGMSYNDIQFQLTDANGRIVRNNGFSNSPMFDVDLNGLQNGIYFYTITNESGNRSTGKLVVSK